jgi:tRNA threonylcarbamoyladenosine biosynthesis protein TsaB
VTILSLDTTSNFASVAIRQHGCMVSEITLESTGGFAHLIFAAIEKCKNEAKLDLDQVDCFAAASGPGSFTGLRVGLSAIKGLAESTGKPAMGVSNLRALSSFGKSSFGKKAVVLDARRGEVYAAVYDQRLHLVSPETVLPLTSWLAQLDPAEGYEFISPAPLPLEGTPFAQMPFTEAPRYLAAAIALCAEQDGREGKWLDPAALDANYVRRSDAELFWRAD